MSLYGYLFTAGYLVFMAFACMLAAQPLVHIFQLESYKRRQFFLRLGEDPGIRRRLIRAWLWAAVADAAVAALGIALLCLSGDMRSILGSFGTIAPKDLWADVMAFTVLSVLVFGFVFAVAMALRFFRWKKQPSKKPLKVTARVVRLDVSLFIVLAAAFFLGMLFVFVLASFLLFPLFSYVFLSSLGTASANTFAWVETSALLLVLAALNLFVHYVVCAFLPRLMALASILIQPVETAVKNWYFNDARKRLAGFKDIIKIGITGSYGKTSTKVILATILSEKYKTYATPHSYNTPMGVTRAIREQLDGSYQVFIAEMGARQAGDIAEMCRLVGPKYGILTSVGAQHLETFKTVENVAKTKYELIEALPADGTAFFPCDNAVCLELYKKTEKPKVLFGLDGCGEPLGMTARDIASGPAGSTFTLAEAGGEAARCTAKLLGRHNVQNILGAAAVARALGLSMEEIARGIGKLEPVEHRLQLIPTNNGVTVIDDAFNSNPSGARAAMEVLKSFPGRKIVVTPGLVELGEAEEAENEAFGRVMADAADIAILVARNAGAMRKGLLEAGFEESRIHMTGRLSEATETLGKLTQAGDAVLFENDLPDHYEI